MQAGLQAVIDDIMIRIDQIKTGTDTEDIYGYLRKSVAKKLRIKEDFTFEIVKHSLDARKKPELYNVYSVDVKVDDELSVLKRSGCKQARIVSKKEYVWPEGKAGEYRPVIIGMGPAGLFCGYMLSLAGCRPIICDRGDRVDLRQKDVESFWAKGILDPESNVQFGEGGAGTFSDGKLNTLVNDKFGRNELVLKIFVENGAPQEILYESKPHIGTDILSIVVANMRNRMIGLGAEFRYRCRLDDISSSSSHITAFFDNGESLDTDALVLAIGHSARDTFKMLYDKGIPMSVKDFAVGLRVLHPRELIDSAQYGVQNLDKGLGAANYKLAYTSESGRGVYSFCMCPGGYVVNASSIAGQTAVNGMSYSKRDGVMSNSGIIVSVGVKDYGSDDALAGMRFQSELEKKAYSLGKGNIPVQTYLDYINADKTVSGISCDGFKGDIHMTDMSGLLPEGLRKSFIEGMGAFDKTIPGFAGKDAILAGIESRTSSPVRIHRGMDGRSEYGFIYPCGEGAGYAGGITSAAMDGIYIAEEIWKRHLI